MIKTATLTFHASHNYGSMLQAYALQQTMIKLFGNNTIINFRSARQKRMMKVISFRPRLGPILKDLSHIPYYFSLKKKYNLFETFLSTHLSLSSSELDKVEDKDLKEYDLICCGSDQIWNPNPEDFDLAYLVPFKTDAIKISYAASMGPTGSSTSDKWKPIADHLKSFRAISVRELGTAKRVKELTGREDISINCDPVFLLDKEEWSKIIPHHPIIAKPYIFLYTLFADKNIVDITKKIASELDLPVIVSNFTNIYDIFTPFEKHLATGPIEFLNLIKNASVVVTSSFHGTAFSILLNKPFVSIKGSHDNRISNLLKLTRLEDRSIEKVEEVTDINWQPDFFASNNAIKSEKDRALEYLSQFTRNGKDL